MSVKKFTSSKRSVWALVTATLILAIAQPTANGLDFPTTTRLNLPEGPSASLTITKDVDLNQSVAAPISEMAKVAAMARQVELARKSTGAKYVARTIMQEQYSWGADQYTCLNRLWTKESHWNYKAHNYRSGAHGIAQALPATKMEVISTDWRTNPVTQIRWGLRYIDLRYDTPCKAWAKFKRSHYY
jgi:Transglycosylase SLT domain